MSLGSALVSGSSFVAASPHTQATFSAEIFAGEGGKRATATRITLSVPGHAPLATPLARSSLAVTIDKLEHTRGGTVSLSIEGDLGDSTGTFHVRVRARTFVRDVVSAKAAYELGAGGGGAGPLRTFAGGFGDAGAMR